MKFQFDAKTLAKQLKPFQATLTATKGQPIEDLIAMRVLATGGLVVYGYAKGQWMRARVRECLTSSPYKSEEPGTTIINRTKFLQLINSMSGDVVLVDKTGGEEGRVEIKPKATNSKFTLGRAHDVIPRPTLNDVAGAYTIIAKDLVELLSLASLEGELVGGGYKLEAGLGKLSVVASDKVRMVEVSKPYKGNPFNFTIHIGALRGVLEILKLATDGVVDVTASTFSTTVLRLPMSRGEEGIPCEMEFGYQNHSAAFPDVSKILNATGFPNSAIFETNLLEEAVANASVFVEDELAWVDLGFTEDGTCLVESRYEDGSAAVPVPAGD